MLRINVGIPRNFICIHSALCTIECFLRKLFYVGLASGIVDYGVIFSSFGLCSLKTFEQRSGEGEAVIIGIVKAFGNYDIHGSVFAWRSVSQVVGGRGAVAMWDANVHQYEMAGFIVRSWFARLIRRVISGTFSAGGRGSSMVGDVEAA